MTLAGLPDAAVQESRERAQTAVKNAGFPTSQAVQRGSAISIPQQSKARTQGILENCSVLIDELLLTQSGIFIHHIHRRQRYSEVSELIHGIFELLQRCGRLLPCFQYTQNKNTEMSLQPD